MLMESWVITLFLLVLSCSLVSVYLVCQAIRLMYQ